MMENAADSDADGVIFDLEDAIPSNAVAESRTRIAEVTQDVDFGSMEVCVRINGLQTDSWLADIDAATTAHGVHTVAVPMIETPAQLETVVAVTRTLDGRTPEILATIETPHGLDAAANIASHAANLEPVTGLSYGFGDYTKAIGAVGRPESIRESLSLRTIEAASLGGLSPIESVYQDYRDTDGLRKYAERASDVGYVGMKAIHPDQIPVLNDVFTPTTSEIDRAKRFVESFDDTDRDSLVVDGVFLDTAIVDQYRTMLARYEGVSQ